MIALSQHSKVVVFWSVLTYVYFATQDHFQEKILVLLFSVSK